LRLVGTRGLIAEKGHYHAFYTHQLQQEFESGTKG